MGEKGICEERESAASYRSFPKRWERWMRGALWMFCLSIVNLCMRVRLFFSPRSLTRAMKYSADGSRGREEWRSSNLHLVLFHPSRPRSRLEECHINPEWAPRGSFRYEVTPRPPAMIKKKKKIHQHLFRQFGAGTAALYSMQHRKHGPAGRTQLLESLKQILVSWPILAACTCAIKNAKGAIALESAQGGNIFRGM